MHARAIIVTLLALVVGAASWWAYLRGTEGLSADTLTRYAEPSGGVAVLTNTAGHSADVDITFETAADDPTSILSISVRGSLQYDTSRGQTAGDVLLLLWGGLEVDRVVRAANLLRIPEVVDAPADPHFTAGARNCEPISDDVQGLPLLTFGYDETRDAGTGGAAEGIRPMEFAVTVNLKQPVTGRTEGAEAIVTTPSVSNGMPNSSPPRLATDVQGFGNSRCTVALGATSASLHQDGPATLWSSLGIGREGGFSVAVSPPPPGVRLSYSTPPSDRSDLPSWRDIETSESFHASYVTTDSGAAKRQSALVFVAGVGAGAVGGAVFEVAGSVVARGRRKPDRAPGEAPHAPPAGS